MYEAFEYDTTFASRDSVFSVVYLNLAIASAGLGYYEESLYQCLESLSLPNSFIEANKYLVLGNIYELQGDEEKGIENYLISARLGFKASQDYLDSLQIIWKE